MPDLKPLLKIFSGLMLLGLILAACGEVSPTPAASPNATNTTTAVTTLAAQSQGTGQPQGVAPTSAVPGATATIQATTGVADATTAATLNQNEAQIRDKALAALKKFSADVKSYNFKMTQSAEIKSGGATSTIDASGTGSYAAPNLYQKISLNTGDQNQNIEYYLTSGAGYQKVDNLAVWRKLDPALPVSANPPANLPGDAAGFQTASAGQGQTQLRYTVPALSLFTQKDVSGPEIVGLLTATNLYQPYLNGAAKTGQAEIKLLVNDANGFVVRREVSFTLDGPGGTLTYKAVYDYSDFNGAGITITPPPNLPK